MAVKLVDTGIVKLGSYTSENRHVFGGYIPQIPVSLNLFSHIAEGIEGASLVKFVDGDDIGEVEHVNFLELRGCAEFGRHNVQ